MKPTVSLSDWYIVPIQVDYSNRYYEVDLYCGNDKVCSYKRVGDNDYQLDNINYRPMTRTNVSKFNKTILASLGERYMKGTVVEVLRSQRGYFGNLALIAEVLIWFNRAVSKINAKAKEVPAGQYVVYTMVGHTIFDSNRLNDTSEFILTHNERDQNKLYTMIMEDAKKNNINMKMTIFATAGVDWRITIEHFMKLYR